jgi:hypothetical protein
VPIIPFRRAVLAIGAGRLWPTPTVGISIPTTASAACLPARLAYRTPQLFARSPSPLKSPRSAAVARSGCRLLPPFSSSYIVPRLLFCVPNSDLRIPNLPLRSSFIIHHSSFLPLAMHSRQRITGRHNIRFRGRQFVQSPINHFVLGEQFCQSHIGTVVPRLAFKQAAVKC